MTSIGDGPAGSLALLVAAAVAVDGPPHSLFGRKIVAARRAYAAGPPLAQAPIRSMATKG
jgi:hypothetical protein